MNLCRLVCPSGVIASYLHASSGPGLGKMGAMVALADRNGALQGEAASKVKVRPGVLLLHSFKGTYPRFLGA